MIKSLTLNDIPDFLKDSSELCKNIESYEPFDDSINFFKRI